MYQINKKLLAERLNTFIQEVPAGYVPTISKVKNEAYDPRVKHSRLPSEIVEYISDDPGASYLIDVDLHTEALERVGWAVCFDCRVSGTKSRHEYQARLKALVAALHYQVMGCSYGMKSYLIRHPEGVYVLFYADRFAKVRLCVSAAALGHLGDDALDSLTLLSPGLYQITRTSYFEIPINSPEDMGVDIADIVASRMEVAA